MTDDIEQIRQLKARYFRLLDTKQWEAWKDCFTEDLSITVDAGPAEPGRAAEIVEQPQGREGFVEGLRVMLADAPTVHHGHMPEITLTGPDSASGIWAMADIVAFTGGPTLYGYGHYHEDYRRQAGVWRIARLHLTRLKMDYWPPEVAAPPLPGSPLQTGGSR